MQPRTKHEKKLIRLISALSDVMESIDAAKAILAGAPESLFNHLFLSMVVAYGRPFTENYGVGCILVDYPTYPEFGSPENADRHRRMIDLRNKFLAHSSAEGTRVQIIPPGVFNPLGMPPKTEFDFNIGRRRFPDLRYVEWLSVLPLEFKRRLHDDIAALMKKAFRRRHDLSDVFELPTGHENFQWT